MLGSLVGGSASIATAWFTQKSQGRRERVIEEIRKRELLYTEFIMECSRLSIDSIDKSLDSPAVMVQVYALQNRIRLTGSDEVIAATDVTIHRIVEQYFMPNLTMLEIREMNLDDERPLVDPIRSFSEACRRELQVLHRGMS